MKDLRERAQALIKALREKPSTYNRELLDEAAYTIEELLEEIAVLRCCDTCKHRRVDSQTEPCLNCLRTSKWEAPEI